MRSCDPSVVRCRLMSSLARVMAVEKPMQYSVPWTSLSMVLGMAIERHAVVVQRLREAQRVVAADRDEVVEAQALDVLEHDGRQVVDLAVDGCMLGRALGVRCAGSRSARILRGFVRDVWSNVPPVRSIVRVESRSSGMT